MPQVREAIQGKLPGDSELQAHHRTKRMAAQQPDKAKVCQGYVSNDYLQCLVLALRVAACQSAARKGTQLMSRLIV